MQGGFLIEDLFHPFRLESDMISFIDQNVRTDLLQQCTGGSVFERLVEDLRGALHYDHCQRPAFHAGIEMADFPEEGIAPVGLYPFLSDRIEIPAEVGSVFLLFPDEKPDGCNIIRVVGFMGVPFRGPQEIAAVRCFSQLPGLQRTENDRYLFRGDVGGEGPVYPLFPGVQPEMCDPFFTGMHGEGFIYTL